MTASGIASAIQPRTAGSELSETRGMTTPRRSGKGCPESEGYGRPGWYVPRTDETVTHRRQFTRRHRPARRERRDCRARDHRRGLSPYSTPYSDPRFPASFPTSPARARPTVKHAQTTRLRQEARTTPITDDASTERQPTDAKRIGRIHVHRTEVVRP